MKKKAKDNKINNAKTEILKEREKILSKSEKIRAREKKMHVLKLALMIISLFLIVVYFLLKIFFESGAFAISLDQEFARKSGLIMYENLEEKENRKILKAEPLDFMDNISVNWLPQNLNNEKDGSHNGDNYLAYTFYLENQGADIIDYWYEIVIDDVIRNVDRAMRIMVYRNDEKTIYGKLNEYTNREEAGTTAFYSLDKVTLKERKDFKPGDIDKFTIVIWIEGDDPDCVDELIGGQMKMHMDITEETISQDRQNNIKEE